MTDEIVVLAGTAGTVGFVHTVLGPDHYLPFIALSRARGWNGVRTAAVTALCGLGHVMGSIVLGFIGLFFGVVVFKLESRESVRGDLAGWLLMAFGLICRLWGVRRAVRGISHEHKRVHADGGGGGHSHGRCHVDAHSHVHAGAKTDAVTPWVLFTIFVLGPCQPLVPLIMFPAAKRSLTATAAVALVFGTTTVATMIGCAMASYYGLARLSFPRAERHSHALAGLAILLCGGAIKFLGL